jgi:hypothetical protein
MNRRWFWIGLPMLALLFTACDGIEGDFLSSETIRGSGKIVTEPRDMRGIHGVDLKNSGDLSITQGSTESLTIEGDDNIIPHIRTEIDGDRLIIRTDRGISIRPSADLRYRLVVKDVNWVGLSGSGAVSSGPLRCADLTVRLSGSGEMKFDELMAENLRSEISGSGSITLQGRVNSQSVRISGSGDYSAPNLESQSGEISISGSGDSTLWVRNSLSARISGSGDIDYFGSPQVEKRVSGSGGVTKKGDHP